MKLVIKNNRTIRKKVYQYIRDKILSGEIAPNERLVETKIAKEIGTSRTPVREALHSLELEKLIRSIPRVGYVVEGISAEEVNQICEIRSVIETLAIHWAMEKEHVRLVRELKRAIKRQEGELKKGNLRGYVELDGQFHEIIAKLSGSERILELAQTLRRHMLRYRSQVVDVPETAARSINGHKKILEAIEKNDYRSVEKELRKHLITAKDDIFEYVFHENNAHSS